MRNATYNDKKANEIISRLTDGETLTSICRDLKLKPYMVYRWTEQQEEFALRFARAREFGDLILEDQAIDISDCRNEDHEESETQKGDGVIFYKRKADNVARSRLQAETRLKIVARRKGARITNEIKFLKKTDAELAAEMTNEQLLEIARMNVDSGNAGGSS